MKESNLFGTKNTHNSDVLFYKKGDTSVNYVMEDILGILEESHLLEKVNTLMKETGDSPLSPCTIDKVKESLCLQSDKGVTTLLRNLGAIAIVKYDDIETRADNDIHLEKATQTLKRVSLDSRDKDCNVFSDLKETFVLMFLFTKTNKVLEELYRIKNS